MDLSIIIPVYNVERYLARCLDSVLGQDFGSWQYEIIIINDGTPDNSLQIAEEYAQLHPHIHVYSQTNQGLSAARNHGIRRATGTWLCFLDSDDYWYPHTFQTLVKTTNHWADAQVVTYNSGSILPQHLADPNNKKLSRCLTGVELIEHYNYNNGVWWYMIRRDFLLKHNFSFVVGQFMEDGMFTMEVFLAAKRVYMVDEYIYHYVLTNSSSITKSRNEEHLRRMHNSFEYAINYLSQLIVKYQDDMTPRCRSNCLNRRNSYIFFYLVRLLRDKMPLPEIRQRLTRLREQGYYPFADMTTTHKGAKFRLISTVLNHPTLYYSACTLYKLIK